MAPPKKGGGGEPTGRIEAMLNDSFGSFEAFKKQFSAAAAAVEGSGWALLHYKKNEQRLLILQAENQHKLSSWGSTPVLGIDVVGACLLPEIPKQACRLYHSMVERSKLGSG